MSGEFPPLNTRQVIQALAAAGFRRVRSAGSHFAWCDGDGRTVTVKQLQAGDVYDHKILGSMIKQSGMSRREFYQRLR